MYYDGVSMLSKWVPSLGCDWASGIVFLRFCRGKTRLKLRSQFKFKYPVDLVQEEGGERIPA